MISGRGNGMLPFVVAVDGDQHKFVKMRR